MPRFIIRVEKHGPQVRVTIPKSIVDDLGLKRIAYALCACEDGKSIIISPFVDEVMLNAAIPKNPLLKDPGSETP